MPISVSNNRINHNSVFEEKGYRIYRHQIMKSAGIVFIIFAGLNFITSMVALGSGNTEAALMKFNGFLMLGVLGAYLIHRANQKKEDDENKRKWENRD